MPRVQIEIPDPPANWLVALSSSHPEDEFRILASYPGENGTIGILEARTRNPNAIREELGEVEDLHSFREMDSDGEVVIIEYRSPEPKMQRLVSDSGTVPRYPVVFRDGTVTATQATSHAQLSELTDSFESAGIAYNIRSLVQSLDPDDLITARQQQFIEKAVDRGYYETPRGCTLTELAAEMDVHKTTAGDVLHRAERRIITEFVARQS
ncbi:MULTISPECIES: helix-turn-helix domain-containing protein [unclassified Haladaptatus]|uniref:helix-turn-helix domain-containing protein n=1 Tax=unclassified Haladaptatus TaxID=2622732 RepID=UPI00209C358F|nr:MULTISPECIES: helix-turn-helix domain-containing protein [unclassified Haladaptatus]MCO8246314.1 helix-turn-helix domain-containing protein [Haladaptatus sp. AB643]MCO8255217.1 helix-turn-helix domain-containing protein [Haladaptatus sp. AB618]